MLELVDGLRARGLLDRTSQIEAGTCRLTLVPPSLSPELTTKQADADEKQRERELAELMYGSA